MGLIEEDEFVVQCRPIVGGGVALVGYDEEHKYDVPAA
jgi:hypothetical protein